MNPSTPAPLEPPRPAISELGVVLIVAAVQFVNILDFVMVMPLGPDFARALAIRESDLGWIASAYTAAAAVSGLAGAFVLDRFDRRRALTVAMVGLVAATALAGLAQGFGSLLLARVLAGVFGGPATSLSLSIISDVVPAERRGRAMGIVMGAFGIASIVGVPAGLELASRFSWHVPFFAVAALGLVVVVIAAWLLPPLTGHLTGDPGPTLATLRDLLRDRLVLLSYTMTATVMGAGFLIIPSLSAYVQRNLGFPRGEVSRLYLIGGCVSVVLTPLVGRLVDRVGSTSVGTAGSAMYFVTLLVGFILAPRSVPVLGIFVAFMVSMSFRNVAYNTLASKVPSPRVRARFMSIQSTVQHASAALGGFASSVLLTTGAGGVLGGVPRLVAVSLALTVILPGLLLVVERGVRAREATLSPVAA